MQKMTWRRINMMLLGNLLIGLAVALLRISMLGTDPFSTINLGISGFLDISFAVYQLGFNVILLAFVFLYYRESIGLGTLVNMVGIGFISDFFVFGYSNFFEDMSMMAVRVIIMMSAVFIASLGVALYIPAGLGMAPYDSLAFVIVKATKNKIAFPAARIMTDVSCVIIGFSFGAIVGVGTVMLAFFTGPFVQFFRKRISEPILAKEKAPVTVVPKQA